ncbi:MAG: hypothetical protein OXE96_10190 [Gemmatimonadetes bacterium]|nr:hypothetical protein [Gemmatimonadota bacterium]
MELDDGPVPYKRFREEPYGRRLKALLQVKGDLLQKEFLESVRDRRTFVNYMSELPVDGIREVPLWDKSISEHDFRALPPELELSLYRRWWQVPPEVASRSGFWGYVTTCHVGAGTIDSTHLAATNRLPGVSAIDQALAEDAPLMIDRCVRTALRRLGGLRPARGHRSVYVDCMFARAWWRERMVEEATSEVADRVRALFRLKGKSLWEDLISRLIDEDGVSVFGPMNVPSGVRSALFLSLARHLTGEPRSPLAQSHQLRHVFQQIATYQATPGLGPADDLELANIVRAIVRARDSRSLHWDDEQEGDRE